LAIRLDDNQRRDWLRLIRTDGIGPRSFQGLINRFGGAAAALEALPEISRKAGRPLVPASVAEIEAEMEAAGRLGFVFVAQGEPDYPTSLRAIDTAPPVIAVRGQVRSLATPGIALVGSRNASAAGLRFAGQLAAAFGQAGYLTISGLARGIDTAVHQASVATGTVAVLAGGLSRPYPPQNIALLDELCETGCAISEMPLGWEPRGRDFPRRNRLISGLSLGLIVVEAARGSGSLITARFALEQGREIFAVPGSPLDPRAEGTNDLIRQGATLCADPSHVLSTLAAQRQPDHEQGNFFETGGASAAGGDSGQAWLWDEIDLSGLEEAGKTVIVERNGFVALPAEVPDRFETSDDASLGERIMTLIGPQPTPVDDLVRLTGASVQAVIVAISELELDGRLRRANGASVLRV
jgi:DNA processing protein